ncbi:MAG: hypothetical protein Q9M91_08750 [Candidatus Dojkabacteria bacterium]|nr:hypothetical protein [Candidatus Dojkabacteria bacterium]MDQ7021861.1 hypothetical protein [Candidatus Dojkabacteria bacterium]
MNFKIMNPKGVLKTESKDGVNSWYKISDVKEFDSESKLDLMDERLDAFINEEVILQELIMD